MAKRVPFILTEKEFVIVQSFLKKGSAKVREYRRAEILLALHNQLSGRDIVRCFNIAEKTVKRVKDRYRVGGLEKALFDDKRSGRPKKFTPNQRAKITALACSTPPDGRGKWSLSLLRDKSIELKFTPSISRSQVARILKKTK